MEYKYSQYEINPLITVESLQNHNLKWLQELKWKKLKSQHISIFSPHIFFPFQEHYFTDLSS